MRITATVASMREHEDVPDLMLYSPTTGQRSSATPGDYFMLGPNEPLTGDDGKPLYLAVESTRVRILEDEPPKGAPERLFELASIANELVGGPCAHLTIVADVREGVWSIAEGIEKVARDLANPTGEDPAIEPDQYEALVRIVDEIKLDGGQDTDIYVSGILVALRLAPPTGAPTEVSE